MAKYVPSLVKVGFTDPDKPIPKVSRGNYKPSFYRHSDVEILEEWFKIAPEVSSIEETAQRVALTLGVSEKEVLKVMKKAELKRQAELLKDEISKKIFEKKLPLVQKVVGLSLAKLGEYLFGLDVTHLSPTDARSLASIVSDFNNLLRLEEGKSTQNLEVQQTFKGDIKLILENTRQKLIECDPFVDYGSKDDKPK